MTIWLPGMAAPFEFKINRESAAGYYLVLGAVSPPTRCPTVS